MEELREPGAGLRCSSIFAVIALVFLFTALLEIRSKVVPPGTTTKITLMAILLISAIHILTRNKRK